MSEHFPTFQRWREALLQLSRVELLREVARGVAIGIGVIIAIWLFGRGYRGIVLARGHHIALLFTLQPYLVGAAVAAWLPLMFPRRVGVHPALVVLALAVPYITWCVIGLVRPHGSLANAVVEPLLVGGVVSVPQMIVFSVPGRDPWQRKLRFSVALGISCLVGIGVALWFPTLPE